ncbi:NHLP-related RiPP peptide [Dokdonella soli]|uniref:Uncharacterized protein n=1 Tax=Dokdonella soli TaxID=529810 RepID=A0ABP3TLV4_9GAMM
MSDAVLTNDLALKLLHELSSNDGFRQRYEEKPAAALIELGIPHEVVVNLNAACLASMKLAKKDVFKGALEDFSKKGSEACLQMITPNLRLKQRPS